MVTAKDEIVKAEILVQAQKLFQQYGLKKTTMDEIAVACGKAKSTLYYYFKSKEEVFDAVILMEMVNLRKQVKDRVEEYRTMLDKIKTYICEFPRGIFHKANLYRIMNKDHIVEVTAKKHFLKMMEFEKSYITRIMEDGYDSGEYTQVERGDIPWSAEMFVAAFYGMVQYLIEKEGCFINEEKLLRVANLFVYKMFN